MSKKEKYVMLYLIDRCIDCKACMVACKAQWSVPEDHFRTHVDEKFDIVDEINRESRMYFLPSQCNHCDDPPCVHVCPTKASHKRDDGIVYIDRGRCIGCKYCIVSCPYDARFFNEELGVAEKCTFCLPRIKEGFEPACVHTCLSRTRIFGDINDPESEVSQVLKEAIKRKDKIWKLREDLGTEPNIYYIKS
ncbi:molybdopterin oxidoreductase, 4Fe-4S ferredoxin [Deferribacter desulfuricans SSM1]|uniref:Molybdopterin oxidoreductase, 4Fe-4S ferredoxin n=1 Tax=Deferribacter desulfuricans (strain DSM 14783 / JCM 11476 / NBRC 101012 / SSM1) TaxID=639282 RepID=D3PC28_DEFDS|nr:4Fe-4S dicluster domain-containing protein [Deferribacter desulfuricans]BAI80151.1 molybdopterin oxidoreductase, 4Fe-4S ferredoxin [Deferribacter desulfuricans SSM1]